MWISLFNIFTKITAWPLQWLCFRTRVICAPGAEGGRRIRGSAIIVSNHTSVFDYAVFLFVFFSRTLRYQMAEVLFEKKPLGLLLKMLGGIRVERNGRDFSFLHKSEEILRRGGVVGVFPESRLPREGEERPLPFKPSAAYLALLSGTKVIPVYTNGSYFSRRRACVVIGAPLYASELVREELGDKENIAAVSEELRRRVIELEGVYRERYGEK